MSSDVCVWTLLRRGCDLQLTFKILQLKGVFSDVLENVHEPSNLKRPFFIEIDLIAF